MKRRTIAAVALALVAIASSGTLHLPFQGTPPVANAGAEVALTIEADRHSVSPGRNITFTIVATNVGDAPAQNVLIFGWQPDWFNFVASGCGSDTVPVTMAGRLTCMVGYASDTPVDLPPGESATLTLVLTPWGGNPKGDRHVSELVEVTWGSDPSNPSYAQAEVNLQIAGKPGK